MLIDTSGFLACFDASEATHLKAVSSFDAAPIRVTHNYVLAEFIALTQARRLPRKEALTFAATALVDPSIETIWVDRMLHDRATMLLESQLDKSYSLCDAVSFLVMRDRGYFQALSTDHHFEQAGFTALLRP